MNDDNTNAQDRGRYKLPSRKGATLTIQRERVCAMCSRRFGSLRRTHVYCSAPCRR